MPFANFNNLLASDATALSAAGDYEYDVQKLLSYELQKDGLNQFNQRYHQGAFGFGPSHPFDIVVSSSDSGLVVIYPDGSQRLFAIPSPTQPNTLLGTPGDYGTVTVIANGSYLLTEADGTLYHFPGFGSGLDYFQDRDGNRTTLTYTGGHVTSVSDAFGNTVSFQYDVNGHITQYTDAAGRRTTFTYMTNTTGPSNQPVTAYFLASSTDPAGTTSYTWNVGGPSGVGYIDDSCIQTNCEPSIGIASIAYPDGTHTYYQYDEAGRLIGQSNDGGAQAVSYVYGSDGTFAMSDALGNTTQIVPNVLGLPLSVTDPLSNQLQFRFDAENKPTMFIGPKGDSTSVGYDSLGNAESLTSPIGSFTSISYTGDQSPLSLTDPTGNATGFSYDAGFDLTTQTSPNGLQTKYTYNPQGNPLTKTNRRGNTVTYTYNANGLPASKTYSNGSQVLYAYDSHHNLVSVTTSAGTTNYLYDAADRLTSLANPDGTNLQFTYNAGGQRTSMIDSTGFITNYSYDAVGRLSGLANSEGATIAAYTYDANGRLLTKTLGNGTSTSLMYDAGGDVLSVINYSPAHAILSEYDYTYDSEGTPITQRTPSGSFSYTYDLNGQLTSVTTPSAVIQYLYDASGNRTGVTTNSSVSAYQPNNLNEYQSAAAVSYQYDADGNLISGNGFTYTYDDDNRMLTIVSATDNWNFQYDGLGNRVASTHNGNTTHYLIDPSGLGNVEAEFNGTGALTAHYTYGLDLTSSVQPTGAASYYHFDGADNTVQVTNASGAVVNNYAYLPFGEQTVLAAGVSNPFTYDGQVGVLDEGLGLYFMRNRWYSPALGRFVQQDPSGLASDINLYRYAGNDPLVFVDPNGTANCPDFVQCFGNSIGGHLLNAFGGFIPGDFTNFIVGTANNVPTVQSFGNNVASGDALGAIHDTAVGLTRYLSVLPPAGPLAALSYLGKFSGLIDESSQLIFNYAANRYYNPPNPCGSCIFSKVPGQTTPVDSAVDPNGKITSGFGNSGYVPSGSAIVYTVYFENQATATLPAQVVTVTDRLASNLDWSSVQFNQIAFNNVTLDLPSGVQTYTTQASVSTDPNPVSVSASLNPSTGVLAWAIQSVDTTTGSAPANPLAGFLPSNNAANAGSGYVTFSVTPKTGLANGATINNQASIVFDANPAIATNTVSNIIDTSSPTSAINPLPATTTSTAISLSWSGSDPSGSGIASYNIYESTDGGAYSLWLSATTLTSSTYSSALAGHTYTFYSLATNNVGVTQAVAATAQTVGVIYLTPIVTVSPAASAVTSAQSLLVTTTVASPSSGTSTPTGTVTLSSGSSYTSAAATLISGAAAITIPSGALTNGSDTLLVSYTPDTASAFFFGSAMGTAQVTVSATLAPTATPVFSVSGGTYTSAQVVTITDATSSATIYYTTNGTTPTTSSAVYSGPITVLSTETLEAIATASGYTTSTTATAAYTITPPVAAPVFSVLGGTYTSAQVVTITDATSGVTIYYTTNGTTPTTSSAVYSGPINVSSTETLEAIATAAGYTSSATAIAVYTIAPPAATPAFSVPAGTYSSAQTVIITDATAGVTIYYTTNGTPPTTNSAVYSGPITISSTETLGAIAAAAGYSASATATAAYTITPLPTILLTSGANGSITIASPGLSGTATVTVTPSGGFTGSVALSAAITSSPAGARDLPTVSFGPTSPVSITGPTAGTGTLTVSTTAATSGALDYPARPGVRWTSAVSATLACLLLFGIPARRRALRTMLGLLYLFAILTSGITGCGGKSPNTNESSGNPGTTTGNYIVTVTATSGSTAAQTTVTITVN